MITQHIIPLLILGEFLAACQSQKTINNMVSTDSLKEANGIVATEKTESTALTGKWKLTANLADPGDGKATWQPAEGKPTYAVFDEKSKWSGEVIPEYLTYIVKDSMMLVFET